MRALSIRQPWAWLILHAGKDVENRTWKTTFRGRVLIHAGAQYDKEGMDWARRMFPEMPVDLDLGGIVGEVSITDCVNDSDSDWFGGPYGFVLADARPLPFRPFKGALYFFEVPE